MKLSKRISHAVKGVFRNGYFEEYSRAFFSGDQLPGESSRVTDDAALSYSALYGCCRVLAETVASVPVHEYKRDLKTGNRERTNETGWYDILHYRSNVNMSAFEFHEMAMYQINLGGNLVAIPRKNKIGEPLALEPFLYHNIEITVDDKTGAPRYEYRDVNNNKVVLPKSSVFHVMGPSMNGIYGMSPLSYAAQAIRLGRTYETFGNKFFQNGANSTGVLEVDGVMEDGAFQRLKKDFERGYTGLVNAGKPIILEGGAKYKPLQVNPVDAELLSSKKFQIEDVARFYRIPLHLIQNLDKATFGNIEQQSLEFVMYTMLPWFKRWEAAINTQLVTRKERDAGYYFEYNMAGLLRGDQKSMAEAFAVGRQWGWLSVNDIRRLMNLNRIKNGDIYLQPMNMIEAGTDMNEQFKTIYEDIYRLIEQKGKA